MSVIRRWSFALLGAICLCAAVILSRRANMHHDRVAGEPGPSPQLADRVAGRQSIEPVPAQPPQPSKRGTRTGASQFSDASKAEFVAAFRERYRPVIEAWCRIYEGHLPFLPEAVTAERFVERVGSSSTNCEYIFVVDGVTLGLEEKKGVAHVAYLYAPQ